VQIRPNRKQLDCALSACAPTNPEFDLRPPRWATLVPQTAAAFKLPDHLIARMAAQSAPLPRVFEIPVPEFCPASPPPQPTFRHLFAKAQTGPADAYRSIFPADLRFLMANFASLGYEILVVIDARFRYEYDGGHISGSVNAPSVADAIALYDEYRGCNACVVFHCEFSQSRGPTLMRAFRDHDRRMNEHPKLSYPRLCLLEGGYSRFYAECADLCEGGYVPMRAPEFVESGELKRSHSAYVRGLRSRGRALMRTHSDPIERPFAVAEFFPSQPRGVPFDLRASDESLAAVF